MTPINTATSKPGTPIKLGAAAAHAFTPNGKTFYVASNSGLTVTPINTGTPIKVIATAIAVTPNGKTAYILSYGGRVTPVNTATNKPGNPITVPSEAVYIAINPNGKTAYVIGGGRLTAINTATNKPGNAIKVTNYPVGMVFTPNGKTAYVLTSAGGCGCGPSGPGTVTTVNTATDKPGTPIRFPKGVGSSAITPNGKTAYVTSGPDVIPVSTATNKPGKLIKVAGLIDMAITPNSKTVYVLTHLYSANWGTVIPIQTATDKPGKAIKVEGEPGYIAITP